MKKMMTVLAVVLTAGAPAAAWANEALCAGGCCDEGSCVEDGECEEGCDCPCCSGEDEE